MFLTGGICSHLNKQRCYQKLSRSSFSFHHGHKKLACCLKFAVTLAKHSAQCLTIHHVPGPPFLRPLCVGSQLPSVFTNLYTWNTISRLWLRMTLRTPTFKRLALLSIAVYTMLDVMFIWTNEINRTVQRCSQTVLWGACHSSVACNAVTARPRLVATTILNTVHGTHRVSVQWH